MSWRKWRKDRYVGYLVWGEGDVSPGYYADLTLKQAERIAAWLEKEKARGAVVDYYLGPPQKMEQLTVPFFTAEGLRNQFQSIIEDRERLAG